MSTPLENALLKLAALKAETIRVERFIAESEKFSGDPSNFQHAELTANYKSEGGNVSSRKRSSQAVDKPVEIPRMSRRRGSGPDQIAQLVERVIREIGQPMTRGQLVQALERRDVELPAADKARYMGTIMWRHKSIFVNVEGRGYWLRDTPLYGKRAPTRLEESLERDVQRYD